MNLTEIHILISPPARLPRTARLGLGRVTMINTLHAYSIAQIIIEVTFIPVDRGYLQTDSALKGDAAQYCVLAYMLTFLPLNGCCTCQIHLLPQVQVEGLQA